MQSRLKLLAFLLIWTGVVAQQPRVEELTILQVDREIDMSSQLVQIINKLKVENTNASPTKTLLFTVEPQHKSHVAFFGASARDTKQALRTSVVPTPGAGDALTIKIELASELTKGKTADIDVEVVLTHYLTPFPAEILQKEKQLVKYLGNHYLYTPYKVNKQTTKILTGSKNIESFTKLKPSSQSDSTITLGPYENIAPMTISDLTVHYENNSPFLTVTKMERTIEVSHWGNIAVEEKLEIVHTGARLKGSFSRFDYQREPNSGINSIKAFKTILPAAARDVYYRDDIGNISTSNMWTKHDSVELILRPRFPLFGGWKTRYVIGYNVPSYEYLFSEGSDYTLKMRLLDHIYDTMIVDELVTKIILPEGASGIKLSTPYDVKQHPRSLHYTYLDIIGRPVITLEGKNLVENHIQDFTVDYSYPKIYMLREPILIVAGFLVLFLTVLIYVRLDFSISAGKTGKSSSSGGNSAVVEPVLKRHGKRAQVYENFENQFQRLKSHKDVTAYQTALKNLTAEHKTETQAINDLIQKHKAEAPELVENITELQRLDRGYWEVYVTYGQAIEKLVAGKMSRQQFMEQDIQFNRKRDELAEKLNVVVKNL